MAPNTLKCPSCGSSRIDKAGLRYLADGSTVQRYRCLKCSRRFSNNAYKMSLTNNGSQICVLKKAKNLDTTTETKTVVGEKEKGQILEYTWKLKKRGLKEKTIEIRTYALNQLLKLGADLNDPDSVETVLATEKLTACKKHRLVEVYRSYTKVFKIPWEPIKTHYTPKQPFVPLEKELDCLISAAGKIFQPA